MKYPFCFSCYTPKVFNTLFFHMLFINAANEEYFRKYANILYKSNKTNYIS